MNMEFAGFLKDTTRETCRFLSELLPQIGGADWWKNSVHSKLSYQQQRRVETGHITKMEDLDLIALMRVFDKNWYEIAEKSKFNDDARTLIKEMQQVRHRASHEGTEDPSLDDLYRDLDTLHRFLIMIGANCILIEKMDAQRKNVMRQMNAGEGNPAPSTPIVSSSDEELEAPSEPEAPTGGASTRGVPLELMGKDAGQNEQVRHLLRDNTYIGIDFGTSTTIVSYVRLDEETNALSVDVMPIKQYDDLGRCFEDPLVPSCIAWTGGKLLVGQGAAQLKNVNRPGKNIWFSFKMELGIDLGPKYYYSDLAGTKGPVRIENPQDATRVFFGYLRKQIEAFVSEKKLPNQLVYSVSVPASFEANQRQDLCNALSDAGIVLPSFGIIDEPNAAFISYLADTLKTGTGVAQEYAQRKRRILVFDFGAGTCDISILEVGMEDGRFISRNKAISQFHALGGDNIDRHIAKSVLLGQLINQLEKEVDFTSTDLSQHIIPHLQPAAEMLKIQCCKYIRTNWNGTNVEPFASVEKVISGHDIKPFTIREGLSLQLAKPSMSFAEFAHIMEQFLEQDESNWNLENRQEDIVSIFEPIQSAMEKANVKKDELDMVLFIGGSSQNPYVLSAIKDYFGRFVESVEPGDLRTPVSRGAALNSFVVNGLKCEIIKPITSEPVLVLTLGGGLREILPAGTAIPSEEVFVDDLEPQRDGQHKIELPICVTNEDKLLATIEITSAPEKPFFKGDKITLTCSVDENKLLHIKAKAGTHMVSGVLVNPLANKELTPEESRMLLARQHLHNSVANNRGRPSTDILLNYAYACQHADHYIEAAEAFEAMERLDPTRDFSTMIGYLYSRAGKSKQSDKWAEIAHKKKPSATTAFNLALAKQRVGDYESYENLMEESLQHNPEFEAALELYGHYKFKKGRPEGLIMLEKAFNEFKEQFDRNTLNEDDYFRFRRAASTLGHAAIVEQIDRRQRDFNNQQRNYSEQNLAASSAGEHPAK